MGSLPGNRHSSCQPDARRAPSLGPAFLLCGCTRGFPEIGSRKREFDLQFEHLSSQPPRANDLGFHGILSDSVNQKQLLSAVYRDAEDEYGALRTRIDGLRFLVEWILVRPVAVNMNSRVTCRLRCVFPLLSNWL